MLKNILLLICLTGCCISPAVGQSSDKERSSLRTLAETLLKTQTDYDAKTLESILTADYVEISPAGEIDERAKVLSFYTPEAKQAAGSTSVKASAIVESIRLYNKVAIVIATFNYEITAAGKMMPSRSIRTTLVCRKAGGQWKVASAQYTGIRKTSGPLK